MVTDRWKMIALAHRKLRRDLREALYLIDATSIKLNSLSADWAKAQRQSFGAKAHVVLDADTGIPVYPLVTAAADNIDAQTVPRQPLQTATDTQRSKAGKTRFSGNIL